jgi:O-antigen ligase
LLDYRTKALEKFVRGNRLSWALLAFAAVASPFPFGSTDAFVIAFWCLVLGLAIILCDPSVLRTSHRPLLSLSAAVGIAFLFIIHEQISLQPWLAAPHPLWAEAANSLNTPLLATVSIARNQPWFAIGVPLATLLTLTVSFVVGADRLLAWRLLRVIAWAGAAYALYSIAASLIEPAIVLWRQKSGHIGSLTGTFLNRNTAATFFGSCSILWLVIILEQLKELLPRQEFSLGEAIRNVLNRMPLKLAIYIGMLLLCLAAMFLTRSRAGVILSLIALVIAAAIRFRRTLPTRTAGFAAAAVVAMGLFVLLETMGSGVGSRFNLDGIVDYGRGAAYWSTLTMIHDRPWFGTGLGTFEMAFPAYRSGAISMSGIWNRAHNTLLELTSDVGIPLAAMIAVGWLFIVTRLFLGTLHRRRDSALPTAGLAVAILGLSHSLVDFSLQITGYVIPFCAIVGTGLAQSFRSDRAASKGGEASQTPAAKALQ